MHTNVVLITGATGNLGSRIMAELLTDPHVLLKLLVYAKTDEEAHKAVQNVLTFWECDQHMHDRIEVFSANITKTHLGLSEEDYTRLAHEITHVIHCAAPFKLNLEIEEAREGILYGTRNVAMLAQAAGPAGVFKHFNHISTIEISGDMEGVVKEEFFSEDTKRTFFNTYEQAKAEAEQYLYKEYTGKGFPVTVYRPAMLVGDSKTGKILNPQSMYHLLTEMFLKPRFPIVPANPHFRIDPIPLDIIARAMCLMYDHTETIGEVYHLTSGKDNTMTLKEFVDALQGIYLKLTGARIKPPYFISPRIFRPFIRIAAALTSGNIQAELLVQRNFIDISLLDVQFDNTKTQGFLRQYGLTIPPLREYLPTLAAYFHSVHPEVTLLHRKRQ